MMEATSRRATFHCRTAPKVNLSAKECWEEWEDPAVDASCSASDAMVSDDLIALS